MAINKVDFGGKTLIDLTSDTVAPETLIKGTTAHDKTGSLIVGAADALQGGVYELVETITITEPVKVIEKKYADCYSSMLISMVTANPGASVGVNQKCFVGFGGGWVRVAVGLKHLRGTDGLACRAVIRPLYGTWDCFGYWGPTSAESESVGQASVGKILTLNDFKCINYLKIYTFGAEFPAGTIINVYGVKK